MPVSSTPLYEKQQTKENNVPYKESGMSGRGVGERNSSYCATVFFSRLDDCLETLRGSWGKGVPDFPISPSHFMSGTGGVGCFMPLQACLSGRRWESREAVIAAQSQPQHTGWSPRARRANSCKDVTSEPLLTTAFPRFAFPLTTLVCLSCWTHFSLFSLLPLLILLPHYPPPTRATAYLISDCLAITLSTFVLCLYPVITWQISSPEKWQPSFTIFFFPAWMAIY